MNNQPIHLGKGEDPSKEAVLQLEKKCEHCQGNGGKHDAQSHWIACYFCEGKGKIITDTGKEILSFIRRNISIEMSQD